MTARVRLHEGDRKVLGLPRAAAVDHRVVDVCGWPVGPRRAVAPGDGVLPVPGAGVLLRGHPRWIAVPEQLARAPVGMQLPAAQGSEAQDDDRASPVARAESRSVGVAQGRAGHVGVSWRACVDGGWAGHDGCEGLMAGAAERDC